MKEPNTLLFISHQKSHFSKLHPPPQKKKKKKLQDKDISQLASW